MKMQSRQYLQLGQKNDLCWYIFAQVTHLFLPTYVTDSRAGGGAGGWTNHRDDAFG